VGILHRLLRRALRNLPAAHMLAIQPEVILATFAKEVLDAILSRHLQPLLASQALLRLRLARAAQLQALVLEVLALPLPAAA
jgi:hypothetical protein